ncbi:MAG: hypothetical protein LBK98_02315, partial [Peptococcaceae bacterium]|nr:hypothetical protein [Peptococcaceae bacterium]
MGNLGQKSLFNQKFLFSKKSLSFVLAILFALSIPLAAYGSWPSFQDDYTNNGVVGTQPPLSQPTAPATLTEVPLANSGAWIGVDAASVINSGVAYTLHNSGSGANVAATPLTGAAPTWDAVINPNAGSGDSQLSTPYYDTATNTLYAATT